VSSGSRFGTSEWHEIQVLSQLARLLESIGNHGDVAREYRRVVRLHRAALQEALAGLGPVAVLALCEYGSGSQRIAVKLALEALRLQAERPLATDVARNLQRVVERLQSRRLPSARRRRPVRQTTKG
jgi:hypothetical protein